LAQGCQLTRDVVRDQPIKNSDVQIPAGRLADRLRREQDAHFLRAEVAANG